MSRIYLDDRQCPYCGWHELSQCVSCKHTSCDTCDAGGTCDCE